MMTNFKAWAWAFRFFAALSLVGGAGMILVPRNTDTTALSVGGRLAVWSLFLADVAARFDEIVSNIRPSNDAGGLLQADLR